MESIPLRRSVCPAFLKRLVESTLIASSLLLMSGAYADSTVVVNPSNGHRYQRIDTPMGWHEAQANCEAMNAHLVTISSAEENSFVYETFDDGDQQHTWWIGATDEGNEGTWRWVTGEPWNFEFWYPGEPNNTGGVEHHAEMAEWRPIAGAWNDVRSTSGGSCAPAWSCATIVPMRSVCEWDTTTQPGVLFADNFNSGVISDEWVSIKPSQWVQDGWLHTLDTNPGRDSFAVVHDGDTSWTDYTYRITADGLLSMGGTVDDFNLLFRTRDVTYAPLGVDGYYYRLEVLNGDYALWRYNGSASSNTVLFSKAGPFDTSNPMVVTVKVEGPRIQVLFNGTTFIDVVDPEPLLYGGIGIGAVWESEARFDDVVVSGEKAGVARPMVQCPGDVNGDSIADIAVLTPDGNARIKGLDGRLVSQFTLSDINNIVDVEMMPSINANGSPELVALGTGSVQAEVWDTLTTAQLSLVNFDPAMTPLDLELVDDQTGNSVPELANLAQGSVKVEVRDGLNGNPVNTVSFSAGFDPMDLEIYPDLNANGSPELAVLGNKTDPTKGDKVEVRDLTTGNVVQNIWLGKGWQVLQQELVADFSGNGADEVAVLRVRPSDSAVNVMFRDTKTSQRLGVIGFDRNYPPTQLLTIADINGNGADEVVVFGQRFNGGNQKAQIKDSKTRALIKAVFFDKNFAGQDIATCADINGNGVEELVMLGKRTSDGKLKAIVKDAKTGVLIGTVNF